MYRLPSQFDPAGRQDEISAAGGGSTSTSCCSCIVTAGTASLITAIKFASLVPASTGESTLPDPSSKPDPRPEQAAGRATNQPPAETSHAPDSIIIEPGIRSLYSTDIMPAWQRCTLGALALVIAAALGGAAYIAIPMFSLFVFIAIYIGIFCLVYEKSGLSAKRGAVIAILSLIAIIACGTLELFIWIEQL